MLFWSFRNSTGLSPLKCTYIHKPLLTLFIVKTWRKVTDARIVLFYPSHISEVRTSRCEVHLASFLALFILICLILDSPLGTHWFIQGFIVVNVVKHPWCIFHDDFSILAEAHIYTDFIEYSLVSIYKANIFDEGLNKKINSVERHE